MSYQETIEVPSMEEFGALASDVASLKAQLGAFQNLQGWLAFITDAKACQGRLDQLTASLVKVRDEKIQGERAAKARSAAIDAREVAIAGLEAALEAREEAVQIREEAVDERYAKIDEAGAMVQRSTDLFKRRLMTYAGIVVQPLQDEPTFDVVENLLRGATDVHMDGNLTTTERGEFSGEVEPLPDAPAIATIRRAKPVRPTRHDH